MSGPGRIITIINSIPQPWQRMIVALMEERDKAKADLRNPAVLAALEVQPITVQDAARVPEIAALIEAAEHLLQNYLRDELDEPDLCVDDEHWSAIHGVNAALRRGNVCK